LNKAKYAKGDIVIAKRQRYSEKDPAVIYKGKIIGVKYVFSEYDEDVNEFEYEVEFKKPFYDCGWYSEKGISDGLIYEWNSQGNQNT